LFQEWEAPDASELYADPANHAIQNPFLLPIIHLGTEIKLQFSDIKKGDILKAASWNMPAQNAARGNIFGDYIVRWTGALYMDSHGRLCH
jgi:hypothetical protein